MSDLSFMETDGSEVQTDSELKQLSNLAKVLAEKRKAIALIEDQLSKAKEEERKISEEEIPMLMLSKNLTSITTEDGFKITVKDELKAYLPKDEVKRSVALRWIISNNGEPIIKHRIEVDDPEKQLTDYLKEKMIPFRNIRDIHNRTLVSFIKGLLGMTKGSLQTVELLEIPPELGPYPYKKTTIK